MTSTTKDIVQALAIFITAVAIFVALTLGLAVVLAPHISHRATKINDDALCAYYQITNMTMWLLLCN
jgi:hypothetical protein